VRRILALALAGLALISGTRAAKAEVFGQYGGAEILPVNGHLFGGYLHASEHVVGLLSQLRLSFYPNIDFGFQGGLSRIDFAGTDVTTVRIGGDLKILVAKAGESFPLDLALGGAIGVETGDDISVLSVGPTAVASRSLPMGSNGAFVPYGGIAMLFNQTDLNQEEDSGVSVPLRLGTEFRFSPEFRVLAEFQFQLNDDFHDDFGLATGINLPF
jgi:hypothetical protein